MVFVGASFREDAFELPAVAGNAGRCERTIIGGYGMSNRIIVSPDYIGPRWHGDRRRLEGEAPDLNSGLQSAAPAGHIDDINSSNPTKIKLYSFFMLSHSISINNQMFDEL